MCKTLLDILSESKREVDKVKNLFPTSEGIKAVDLQYGLDGYYEETKIYDRPDIVKYGKDPLLIGQQYLNDFFDLNLLKPQTFEIQSVGQGDISVIDMPSIEDVSEGFYLDIINCNFYADKNYEFIGLEPCPPFTTQEKNYLDYVRRLQNNGNIFDVFSIFTGQKTSDTKIGLIGAESLQAHFNTNIKNNANQTIAEFIETDPFRFIQTNNLLRVPYDITVPKTAIGKFGLLLEKLSGAHFPFSYLPNDAFDLNRTSVYNQSEQTKILLEYTGAGQKQEMQRLLVQNNFRPKIIDNDYGVTENEYVVFGLGQSMPFTDEFNSEYIVQTEIDQILTKKGYEQREISRYSYYQNPLYGVNSKHKNNGNQNLFSEESQLVFGEDENINNAVWNANTPNTFNPKTLLYKTKKIVNDNSSVSGVFIDTTKKEISYKENGEYITISRGDGVTAAGDWDNEDYQIKKGDFFRVWTKDRKYSKLNRAIFHRGLDNGDKRSVLGDNGLLNFAPTYRTSNDHLIKKYMFSLENLAWADNIADLPECEVGVGDLLTGHKGRIMWFPPYDLSFSESANAEWNKHKFIGRGEPVFTLNGTERSGTISFTMIVDHPSIVNKIRGERTELWERYFKGDKSVEAEVKTFVRKNLNQTERDQLEKIRKKNISRPKITNEKIVTADKKNNDILIENLSAVQLPKDAFKFASIYFPNNIDQLPTLTGGEKNNQGYQSNFQVANLDYTYYKGVKRDKINELKTGKAAYANKSNYQLNEDFFSPEFIKNQFDSLFDQLKEKNALILYVTFVGYASQAIPKDTSNFTLSKNRAMAAQKWFEQQLQSYKVTNDVGDVIINTNNVVALSDLESEGTGEGVEIDARNAVEARRAEILIEFDNAPTDNPAENLKNINDVVADDNLNQDVNLQLSEDLGAENLSPDLLEKLFGISECDMFEYMETYDPHSYATISEKIKYFQPAFHSMTPEGFNGRLNFLQQCTRQGQSIGIDGIDNLTNFAFGRPPVCILKIGDFFHTKIIIESLSINYENPKWDLNPQGFVAPMIAKISLSIQIIGGQSISSPINRLQNALSFNYYSSMEMFEPRADSVILNQSNNENRYEIVDGIKLSKIISPEQLAERNDKIVSDIQSEYGRLLPVQKINSVTTPLFNNVPSDLSKTSDIIQLKRNLNLPLTQEEKDTLNN